MMMMVKGVMNMQTIKPTQGVAMVTAAATTVRRNQICAAVGQSQCIFLAGKKDHHKPYREGEKQILH